jgi:hypothetical protein
MKKFELKRLIIECIDELIDMEFPLTKKGQDAYDRSRKCSSVIQFNSMELFNEALKENMGALSNQSIKNVTEKIYDKFAHLIKTSTDLKDLISKHDSFEFNSENYNIKSKPTKFKIELKFIALNQKSNTPYISARIVDSQSHKELEIHVNDSSTLNELLNFKQHLFKLCLHECKHVFDVVTKGELVNLNPYEDLVKYLNHSQEYHAYLSNIILEMKEYSEKHPDCIYDEALESSGIWQMYINTDKINPRIKRYFLEKTAYWWINER